MNFSTNENYKLLREIVTENITTDIDIFNKVFQDFSKNSNTDTNDLMLFNKQFLTLLQTIIHNKTDYSSSAAAVSQKRKVSFDNKLEEHKQHFLSYTPKPPHIPDFLDKSDNTTLGNIDNLIKQTLLNRNYEPIPTPINKPPRKINIHQSLEHDTLTQDAINLDSNDTVADPITTLFSKLQNKNSTNTSTNMNTNTTTNTNNNESIIIDIQQTSVVDSSNTIPIHLQNIQNNINNIVESFEKLKLLLNK
jgi:hypothetical protein